MQGFLRKSSIFAATEEISNMNTEKQQRIAAAALAQKWGAGGMRKERAKLSG